MPVCGALGDQQAALFGQACFEPGEAKNTYGTGCFLLLNTGTAPMASLVADNGDVYCVPAFSGLFAPYWRSDARGIIAGLTRYANKSHIARAVLEATAFQTRDIVEAMNLDSGVALTQLKVDGGMVHNRLLMQFQADLLNVPVICPKVAETTALGAAYAAGLAVGFWSGTRELKSKWAVQEIFQPKMDESLRRKVCAGWKKAVNRTLGWVDPG